MYRRVHEPEALDPRSALWPGGRFDAGRRPMTPLVEGVTRTADHLLLVTLRGGARRLSVVSDCGHRYEGPDCAGAVSFVPGECERRLRLEDVAAEWASVALAPAAFADEDGAAVRFAPFSNAEDRVVAALVGELDRAHRADGALDPAYGETVSLMLIRYLTRRYGTQAPAQPRRATLPRWRLARIEAYVEANLHRSLSVSDLAAVAGMSAGHFHRAFRETTGATPLAFLTERRVRRALEILKAERAPMIEVAARVGFDSPSHFARMFRRITGRRPSDLRGG
jgi:AraC family transcriptional regulator